MLQDLLARLNGKFNHSFDLCVVDSPVCNAWTNGQTITFTSTIMSLLTAREAEAVMLHEYGHAHCGHTHKLVVSFVAGWGAQLGCGASFQVTGDRRWFLAFMSAFTARSVGEALLHKHFEYEADSFAVAAGYGDALSSALMKITAGHTGEFSLTHPSTDRRVARIKGTPALERIESVLVGAFKALREVVA